jgi:type IV secretion system protein VirB10
MTDRRDEDNRELRGDTGRDRRREGVVSVNRVAIVLGLGVLTLGGILILRLTQGNPPPASPPPAEKTTGTINALPAADYALLTKPAPAPEPPQTVTSLLQSPVAPAQAPVATVDTEAENARVATPRYTISDRRQGQTARTTLNSADLQEKLLQLSLGAPGTPIPGLAAAGNDPAALAALAANLSGSSAQAPSAAVPASSVDTNLRFARSGALAAGDDGWSQQRLQPPKSRYEIKAGSILNAALRTALHSDLPGDIVAQLTLDVRDSVTGRYVLLPAGTTVLGRTNSAVGNGQDRLQVIWTRLVLPNGKELALDSLTGADKSGAAGLADRVDYHFESIGLGVVLSTILSVGGNLARGSTGYDRYSLRQGIGDGVAQSASNAGSRIVDRQLNIPPTITVREGTPVTAIVNRTMVLEPYQPQR